MWGKETETHAATAKPQSNREEASFVIYFKKMRMQTSSPSQQPTAHYVKGFHADLQVNI